MLWMVLYGKAWTVKFLVLLKRAICGQCLRPVLCGLRMSGALPMTVQDLSSHSAFGSPCKMWSSSSSLSVSLPLPPFFLLCLPFCPLPFWFLFLHVYVCACVCVSWWLCLSGEPWLIQILVVRVKREFWILQVLESLVWLETKKTSNSLPRRCGGHRWCGSGDT